jgi:tetratricopeptide (TPR) repeat protein
MAIIFVSREVFNARLAPIMKCMAVLSTLLSLSSCAGFGVVDPPDPLAKLNLAEHLFVDENRPVPADTLIHDAIVIYQKRDDSLGLGNAYREYGDFLSSAAVFNWRTAYSHGGFSDPSVTYDNRLEKASEYYTKALTYYRLAETQESAAGKYDTLTGVYYNMAHASLALGLRDEACGDYDRALQAYHENMARNPAAHPHGSRAGTVPESIAAAKKGADCTDVTP